MAPRTGDDLFGRKQPQNDKKAPPLDEERGRIRAMRISRLYRAGYPHEYAVRMADDPSIDLHQAEDVLSQSGDLDLCLRILL